MMTFRDKEQYSMLLGRICPHCIALAHDELERLLRTPRGPCRAAVRDRIFWGFARSAAKLAETCKSLYNTCAAYEDLASEGFVALFQAIDTFDAGRIAAGTKYFPNYSTVIIRRALHKYACSSSVVRNPARRATNRPAIIVPIDDALATADNHARPDAACVIADVQSHVELAVEHTDADVRNIIRARCGLIDDSDLANAALQARQRGITKQGMQWHVRRTLDKIRKRLTTPASASCS